MDPDGAFDEHGLQRRPQLHRSFSGDGIEIYENSRALPFAFFSQPELSPVQIEWGINEIRLQTAGRGGWLTVGVAPLRWYVGSADGEEIGPVGEDENRRLVLEVPAGTRQVVIRYVDVPFRLGVGVLVAWGISLAAIRVVRRLRMRQVRS